MSRNEIDPRLPFIQLHDSIWAKAADLASLLGIRHNEAVGNLAGFWRGLADRRLLTGKTEIVLSIEETIDRLHVAFAKQVEPKWFVLTGFLEVHPNGYRVRGMSRYIATEQKRSRIASAKTLRKQASESPKQPAQVDFMSTSDVPHADTRLFEAISTKGEASINPESGQRSQLNASPTHVKPTSGVPHVDLNSTSSAPHVDMKSTEDRGERIEERVDTNVRTYVRTQAGGERAAPKGPVTWAEPTEPPDTWDADQFFQWAQFKRTEAGLVGERSPPRNLSFWYSTACMELGGNVERLQDAFFRFGEDKHWQKQSPPLPFRAFVSQWDRYVSKGGDRC